MPWIFVFIPCRWRRSIHGRCHRGREASRLRDTAGKQHEKELQALQKWGSLEPFPGKAWKSCHAHGPEVEDEIFHDFPRSCYYWINLNCYSYILLERRFQNSYQFWQVAQLFFFCGESLLDELQHGAVASRRGLEIIRQYQKARWDAGVANQKLQLTCPNCCPSIRFWG